MNNFLVSKKQFELPLFSKSMNFLNNNLLFRKTFRRFDLIRGIVNEPYCNQDKFIFKPHHEGIGYDYLSRFIDKKYTKLSHDAYGTLLENVPDGLDYSQKVVLSYMQKSICDYSNLRLDKGLMSSSIEPRAPFLNLDLVNFFLSMPNTYRYRDGYAKFILRKMVEKYVGSKIAWRSKHGFSYPVWKLPEIRNKLNINKNISNSNILNDLPFTKNGKKYLIEKNYSKLAWPLFAIAKIKEKYNFKFNNF
jgi:asparagine synthetase B (glutamine-hydrolysing)